MRSKLSVVKHVIAKRLSDISNIEKYIPWLFLDTYEKEKEEKYIPKIKIGQIV